MPRIISAREPEFSEEARSRGFQGVVSLNITIDPAGRVSDVAIIHPLGMGLDEKAIECVKAWQFAPARHDGQPVAVALVYIEVDFHL
jgi:TonB family protein